MNRRAFVCSLAAVLPFVAAGALVDPAAARFRGPRPEARLEKHLHELGLDPGQMEKVRAILGASKQERRERRSQLRAAFEQMRALLEREPPDEPAIMQQAEKIGQLKTEGHKAMLRTLLRVRAELTPEQRQQLKEMKRRGGWPFWRRKHRPSVPDED